MKKILDLIRAVADPRAVIEAYGSSVYAPAHAHDVDVLVTGDDADRLAGALGLTRIPTKPPKMTGVLEGMQVDITVVTEADSHMRSGPRDAALLAQHLSERDDVFQTTWPHVRAFVKTRALGHNGLGWFGSFGWALLLAIPLVTELRDVRTGEAFAQWLRWLARLKVGSRVSFDGIVEGEESLFLVAPAPPIRDVARLSRRHAQALIGEAAIAVAALGDAVHDEDVRILDIAAETPTGTILVISGMDEHGRGRYDGNARGLLRELDRLGPTRSWGRFDTTEDGWEHRIMVPTPRIKQARAVARDWLALTNIDAAAE